MARRGTPTVLLVGIVLSTLLPQCGTERFDLLSAGGTGGGGGGPQSADGGKQKGGNNLGGGKGQDREEAGAPGADRGGTSAGGFRSKGGAGGGSPIAGGPTTGRGPEQGPCGLACGFDCFRCPLEPAMRCDPRVPGGPARCIDDAVCGALICAECDKNEDCQKAEERSRCNRATKTCTAPCSSDGDCESTTPLFPHCDEQGICVECLDRDDCGRDPRRPACRNNTCVGCEDDGDCSNSSVCIQNFCRECTTSQTCGDDEACVDWMCVDVNRNDSPQP